MFYAALTLVASFIIDLLTLSSKSSLDKDLEILALRHQLRLLQRQLKSKPRASRVEKLLLAVLAVKLKSMFKRQMYRLDQCLLLFKPNTVLKWHRELCAANGRFNPGVSGDALAALPNSKPVVAINSSPNPYHPSL